MQNPIAACGVPWVLRRSCKGTEQLQKGVPTCLRQQIKKPTSQFHLKSYFVILIIGLIGATPILKDKINQLKEKGKVRKVINALEPVVLVCLLIFVTAYLVDNSYNPFLYFRF